MTDLAVQMRAAAHLESARHAPRTTAAIEALNAGVAEIERRWLPIEAAPRVELEDINVWNGVVVQCGMWWEGLWVSSTQDVIDPQPTHWTPLPAPPTKD